jgi:cytochrome P450
LFAAGEVDEEGLLKKLPAVNGAIMETMRLYPIAVAQMRTANKSFVFEGHQIHEGEMIYIGTSVPHFMDEYWPKAKTFDIDRYQSLAPSICSLALTRLTAAARTPAWARAWPKCRWHCR